MIKVMIERYVSEGVDENYKQLAKEILKKALEQPGYLSGASLIDANDPLHKVIITNWQSYQDWSNWLHSEDRKKLCDEMAVMLTAPEKATALTHA